MTLREAEKGWGGVYSLLLTPYHEDLSIDYDLYGEYVRWQTEQGAHHLFSVCGSSEMSLLTKEERIRCAAVAVRNSCGHKVVATANTALSRSEQIDDRSGVVRKRILLCIADQGVMGRDAPGALFHNAVETIYGCFEKTAAVLRAFSKNKRVESTAAGAVFLFKGSTVPASGKFHIIGS